MPASINNDLPASDMSIGADSALNSITTNVDKIKHSAAGQHQCSVVEVMGDDCGFLALMAGLTTGAELVYLPEVGYLARGAARRSRGDCARASRSENAAGS